MVSATKTKSLYSFDIFDTLVTRTVANPVGIFTIMQMIMSNNSKYSSIPEYIIQNFYTIRTEAENYTRTNYFKTKNRFEITLSDIYETIKRNYYLTERDINLLIELEISTEIKNIRPIDKNIKILKQLISDGERVILISDMYHTQQVLRQILTHIDPIFENITVYVSSEYNKTKHEGSLYQSVQEKEGVEPSQWKHYGDNFHADIKQAKLRCIQTQLTAKNELLPYEKHALEFYDDDFYVQSLTGIAKYTRTIKENSSKTYDFGCSFAGPILYNYVSWVIEQSLLRGFETLNFVARDGYVLKNIADVIIKQKGLSIKTKYLYGSREAWRIPYGSDVEYYISRTLYEFNDRMSLKFLQKRFRVNIDLLKKITGINNENKILSKKKIQKIKDCLVKNEEFKKQLTVVNTDNVNLLKQYLKENTDLSSNTLVLVDVHGSGATQDFLSNIVKDITDAELFGFYFHNDCSCKQDISKKISYFSGTKYISHAIELLCRNLDGQTLGYKKTENGIVPIFENIDSSILLKWGYEDYLQGLKDFAKNASEFEQINNLSLKTFNLYKIYYKYFKKNLDKDTADIIGSIPYKVIGNEKKMRECAPKLSLFSVIFKIFEYKNSTDNFLEFVSVKRSSKLVEIIENINKKYGSVRKLLVNINIQRKKKKAYFRLLGIKISFSKLIWRNK